MVEKRFRSLRIIGTVLKVLAWIALVMGIIGAFIAFIALLTGMAAGSSYSYAPGIGSMAGGVVGGILGALLIALAAVINFLFLYAAGEAIDLALAIEENTRETAQLLKAGDSLMRRG